MACRILLYSTVGWPSVARLAHGFAAASCHVEALAPAGAILFSSRYVSGRHAYSALSPLTSLRQAIAKSSSDLIVACDDRAVMHLLKLHATAENGKEAALVRRSLGDLARYPELMSRSGFMARAQSLGVRVPATRPVSSVNELDAFIADAGLPVVLKSDGSWGGEGVVVARSAADAHAAFARLSRAPSRLRSLARALRRKDAHFVGIALAPEAPAVSVQAFVAGRASNSAFACWNGEILGAIHYDVLVSQGEFGPPNVIRRVDCPQLEEAARRIAAHYGLSGIHGMDFLRDAAGVPHLIELNPRATQGSTLPFGRGRDLPAALASRLQPGGGMRKSIASDTVAIFPREWQRDPSSPWLATAHHDVPWDDPAVLLASLRGTKVAPPPPPIQPDLAA